jgi:hypothetical protein
MNFNVQKVFLLSLLLIAAPVIGKGLYLTPQLFLEQSFGSSDYEIQTLWLNADDKSRAGQILQRDYQGFRVRYWQKGEKRAWILDEIGKMRPITIGVVISENKIDNVSILEFRESRGDEVRYPFFTKQFIGRSLQRGGVNMTGAIDGITGATLSVRAVTRVARLALYLNERASFSDDQL